jgi:hypothetical protein
MFDGGTCCHWSRRGVGLAPRRLSWRNSRPPRSCRLWSTSRRASIGFTRSISARSASATGNRRKTCGTTSLLVEIYSGSGTRTEFYSSGWGTSFRRGAPKSSERCSENPKGWQRAPSKPVCGPRSRAASTSRVINGASSPTRATAGALRARTQWIRRRLSRRPTIRARCARRPRPRRRARSCDQV